MKNKWPSVIVGREKIPEFTGGLISSRYMANLDSQGQGPPKKIKFGRKIGYPIDSLII